MGPWGAIRRPRFSFASEAESEKTSFASVRATALFAWFTLSLRTVCDEVRNALHHSLARSFAADIDVAVVGNKRNKVVTAPAPTLDPVSSSTRLLSNGEKRTALGRSLVHRTHQSRPPSHRPFRNARINLSIRFVRPTRLGLPPLTGRSVIYLDRKIFSKSRSTTPAVPFGNVLLCFVHCLPCAMPRSEKPWLCSEKRRVPTLLQNLQHRLLNKPVQHARNA